MDSFVHHTLRYKFKSVSVPTDKTTSFWFYERYRFKRWAEYHDSLESYLADRPIKASYINFFYIKQMDESYGVDNRLSKKS